MYTVKSTVPVGVTGSRPVTVALSCTVEPIACRQ